MASNFGRICLARSPESFTTIVNDVLYSKAETIKQSQHDVTFEPRAIQALQTSANIVTLNCGLYIDEKQISLWGRTGLVDRDAIVMIKCPLATYGKNVSQSMLVSILEERAEKKG